MHEYYIASEIVRIVEETLRENNSKGVVKSIEVKVGKFSHLSPEALVFTFDILKSKTPATGATLLIEHVDTVVRCGCGREFKLYEPVFICPYCGSTRLEMVSGREIELTSIELEGG